jgi:hypothetical protein
MKGLAEVKAELARQQGIIAVYDQMVTRQQGTIDKLLDRIQAGSFREFKQGEAMTVTYPAAQEFYEPLEDEELAGTTVKFDEGETSGD